ncbi:Ig-like domain-containing protein [Pseudidiomarina woesei]|uniref:Carboxypeptidase regulatory-like domain-containing protein n=1 Tax=Pseudidiomarina woesei TaxID=1381080 RepID=A0A0K6H6Y7_9GAMM|nr:Ig-like domain-containing protein [Pseudidiomarina woesei]CUA86579.1 hypothetical protein Ga0061064_1526 [Pseudidiomarina woesei]
MFKRTKTMLALMGAGLLFGCGSDNDDPTPPPPPPPPPAATYELSGTVTGLDGSLTLAAGDEEQTVTADGTVTFDTEFESGDEVTVSITEAPDLQSCEITSDTTFTFDDADISDLAVTCTDLVLYSAVDDTAASTGGEISIDVLANDTSEYATTFTLVSVTEPTNGAAVISDTTITYTPDDGFAGTDTFMYTGTDGAQEDTATVTVTVTQTVTIAGRVTDGPIANATVTVSMNGQTYTATADANGDYQLELPVVDSNNGERPRLTAQGADTQSHVRLSSRLPSAGSMLNAAGEDGTLVRAESGQVQVTQLTTAENLQLERIASASGGEISDDNIQELMTEYDNELALEMAAAIKLLVDDPNYQLPEGYESIEEFIADEEAYNTMVDEAEASGDLERALEETINDPEVAGPPPGTGLEDYYGAYVVNNIGSRYTGRWAPSSVYLSADGMRVGTTSGSNTATPVPLVELEDGSWEAATSSTSDYNINFFSLVNIWGVQMEASVAVALEAAMNETQWPFPIENANDVIKVISSNENSLVLNRGYERRFLAYTFTWEGVEYTIPEQMLEPADYVQTWLPKASLMSGIAIEVPNNSQWVVPQIFDYYADINPEYQWGEDFWYDSQLVTMTQTTATTGTYTNDLTGATGTWSLSEDGTALTLITEIDEGNAEITLWYSRKDQHVAEFLAQIDYIDEGEAIDVITIERGGMISDELAIESLIHADDEMNLALVNMQADDWGDNGPIYGGDIGWLYGWHLAASGDLQFLVAYCDDPDYFDDYLCSVEGTYWHQSNEGEGEIWVTTDDFLHLVRPQRTSAPECTGEIACGGRFVSPISYNASTGIMTILEMELVGDGSPADIYQLSDGVVEGGVYQWIAPRINYWTSIPFNGTGPGNGPGVTNLESPIKKYNKVLKWSDELGVKH